MENKKEFMLKCNACNEEIDVKTIKRNTYRIKEDKNRAEIRYFSCPKCGQRYFIGIYDKDVNSLFKRGKRNKGKDTQEKLKEMYQEEIKKVMERKSNHEKI